MARASFRLFTAFRQAIGFIDREPGIIGGSNMTNKPKQSKMLASIHEAAIGLHKVGFIDKRKMEKYNLLCRASVPEYSPEKIKALRKRYDISQAVLAAVINISPSTVSK